MDAELEKLAGQVAESIYRDAMRYRWLRQQHWSESAVACVVNPKDAVKLGHDCPSHERLDEVIDAAIRSGAPAQEE